jgi:hypothetical protein
MKREPISDVETSPDASANAGRKARPTLKTLLLADTPRGDLILPVRGRQFRRFPPDAMETPDQS